MSTTESAATPDYTPIPRYAGLLKAMIILATLMQVLDMTIANVALPHMQAALGVNQDSISWVLTSYIIASAIAIPITGWLADRIGRRKLYLGSVVAFVIASVLCGLAANIEEMVLFRVLQGVSGAFLSPLAQTVLLDITPREKHGQAMAMFGMGVVLGPILGPILGGWLTGNMSWRWVFLVNVPLGAVAFAGLWFLLPDVKRPARRLDIFGFALLAVGLASLQLMLDRGQHVDWFNSVEIWLELGIAISALWMFVVHTMTGRDTLYPKDMLADRNLLVGMFLMATMGFILTAVMALMPILLQSLFGYPVLEAGMLMATRGLGVIVSMAISGKLINRTGPQILTLTGFLAVIAAFWQMGAWGLEVSWQAIAFNGVLQGIGLGMLFVPLTTIAFGTLPARYRTDGSGLLNLSRSMGGAIGVSLVITVLARNEAMVHANLASFVTPYRLLLDPRLFSAPGDFVSMALTMVNTEVTRQASMIAFINDFHFMMIVTICAIPVTLLVKRPKLAPQSQAPMVAE